MIPTPPPRVRERRCQDAMFDEFYEVGRMTVFDDDRTFALQLAAAGRVDAGVGSFIPTTPPPGGFDVTQAGMDSPSPGIAESTLFQKSPFGIPREEDVDSDLDEFEETQNPGMFFDALRGAVTKATAPETSTAWWEDPELADLPSAKETYGVGLARPCDGDIALFHRYPNLDRFLEGEDDFEIVEPSGEIELEKDYTIIDRPIQTSGPAQQDHQPVVWRAPVAPRPHPLSLFTCDLESLKRVEPHYPTAFSAVPDDSLALYEQFVRPFGNSDDSLPALINV